MICPSTHQAEAAMLAERIRQSVAALIIATSDGNCSFTISIGVAEFELCWRVDDLLRAADTKLYQAKSRGRNLVVV